MPDPQGRFVIMLHQDYQLNFIKNEVFAFSISAYRIICSIM